MKHNEKYVNDLIERSVRVVEEISNKNNYDDNIRHLLNLILPAFVLKYGFDNERIIIKCFNEIKIITNKEKDSFVQAYFRRTIREFDNKYYTNKGIVINDYNNVSFLKLIDGLIHEMNHAVNSINNEIKYDSDYLYLRSGLCYTVYDRKNLIRKENKSDSIILEEIINTKQTEEIIDKIKSLSTYNITNEEITNILFSIKSEIVNDNYKSDAYYLQSYICNLLLQNRTFISTLESLRFSGNIEDIESWFDDIIGINNGYKRLCILLNEILELEKELTKKKYFKNKILTKIKIKTKEVMDMVRLFDENTLYR